MQSLVQWRSVMPMMISIRPCLVGSPSSSCALEERGKNEGKTKGGQCLNTLCLRSGDSRTGIFQGILRCTAG